MLLKFRKKALKRRKRPVRKASPRISAIIPVYNGRQTILEAVNSVASQTLKPIELIVIDDGSTDNSLECLNGRSLPFPVIAVRQDNGGQSNARNRGAFMAKGKYIAFLDQDDRWYPDHLKILSSAISKNTLNGWAYSNVDEIDTKGGLVSIDFLNEFPTPHPKKRLIDMLSMDMFILPSAALILKKAFDEVSGFDERLSGYEDDDLFLRIFRKGYKNVYVDQSTTQWRIHTSSCSFTSRMTTSRRTYADKLMSEFPNDPQLVRYWVRDVIAPRFLENSLGEFKLGIETGNPDRCMRALIDLAKHRRLTGREKRWRNKMAVHLWLWWGRLIAFCQIVPGASRMLDRLTTNASRPRPTS